MEQPAGLCGAVDLNYSQEDEIDSVEWYSRFLFSHYRKSWQDLLGGGSGRLTCAPDSIWISAVASWTVPHYPGYELRAVRVWTSSENRDWLTLKEDWPVELLNAARPG